MTQTPASGPALLLTTPPIESGLTCARGGWVCALAALMRVNAVTAAKKARVPFIPRL
jgi:hypothetical protein